MAFYFTVHLILGFLAGSSAHIVERSRHQLTQYPLWVTTSPFVPISACISGIAAFAAIPTTLFSWGLVWMLYTIGELVIGCLLVLLIPNPVRLILLIIGPGISVGILGLLWGFWYI